MKNKIQLSIPEPCHEPWDDMAPTGPGRFCGSCQKQVIDFSKMSDEQIALFFKSDKDPVCGRFRQHQLDRTIGLPKKRIPWVKYFFQFALPAFLISTKATAQGSVRVGSKDTIITPGPGTKEPAKVCTPDTGKRIWGTVLDENGKGIPFSTIMIKGTSTGTAADSSGRFDLFYRGTNDRIVLVSSCVGFQSVETPIHLDKAEIKPVMICHQTSAMLGEVIVVADLSVKGKLAITGAISVKRVSIFDSLSRKIIPSLDFFRIFPNPVRTNSSLTIETGKHEEGNYVFQLIAITGQVAWGKEIWMEKADKSVRINLPPVAPGAYFLSMTSKQSGKVRSEKIVIVN